MPRAPAPKAPSAKELRHALVNKRSAALAAISLAHKGNGDAAKWAALAAYEMSCACDLQLEQIIRLLRARPQRRR